MPKRNLIDHLLLIVATAFLLLTIGFPKKNNNNSVNSCSVYKQPINDTSKNEFEYLSYSFLNLSSSKNTRAEIFNLSQESQGAILEVLNSDGKIVVQCSATLNQFQQTEIPLEQFKKNLASENFLIRVKTVSPNVITRLLQGDITKSFIQQHTTRSAILFNDKSQSASTHKIFIANLSQQPQNFILQGKDNSIIEPIALIVEAGKHKLIELTELVSNSNLKSIAISPVNLQGEVTKSEYFVEYIAGLNSEDIPTQKKTKHSEKLNNSYKTLSPLSKTSYITISKFLEKYNSNSTRIENKLLLLNLSNESAKIALYFHSSKSGLIPIKKDTRFCDTPFAVEEGIIEITLPAQSSINCHPNTLLNESNSDSGQLLFIPETPNKIAAQLTLKVKDKKNDRQSTSIQFPSTLNPDGNSAIMLWDKANNIENYLSLYNPNSTPVEIEINHENKASKSVFAKIQIGGHRTVTVLLNKENKSKGKAILSIEHPILAQILQLNLATNADEFLNISNATYYYSKTKDSNKEEEKKPTPKKCTPVTNGLKADLNRDGMVDEQDKAMLETNVGKTSPTACEGDIDGDGDIDADDLLMIGLQWTGKDGLDSDKDGKFDASDCSPKDSSTWRNEAFKDFDNDGIRDSLASDKTTCHGEVAPKGFTINENGPDNCPNIANPDQTDGNQDGLGDACNYARVDPIQEEVSQELSEGFPNPQTFKPLKSNPNGLKGEQKKEK